MAGKLKKLSIALYWHFYQPVYGIDSKNDYLMPWTRLHAVRDYLSMLSYAPKNKNIKLNINISPTLLDDFLKYGDENFHDIHSRLTVKDVSALTDEEKRFILDNFFDVNFERVISRNERYLYLAQKYQNDTDISSFSSEEYSDLMALFNLVWINEIHFNKYPELKKLIKKGKGFSLEERQRIIEIHRDIIRRIIPEMKKLLKSGKIDLSTSPYYHPLLPVLTDYNEIVQDYQNDVPKDLNMQKSAMAQITSAISRFFEIFNILPSSIWLPEFAISTKVINMLAELGIKWIVADESCLANSNKEILTRDFDANLENPYPLLKTYNHSSGIKIIFRDSLFPNLINYEYLNMESQHSADDLYNRIKIIQSKIQSSPDDTHLLTIALDGENCWEFYNNYGNEFLEKVYKFLSNDGSVETVLISDYVSKDNHIKQLNSVKIGTYQSQDFRLWIGEPLKNKAWHYLKKVKDDLDDYIKNNTEDACIHDALKEFFICQASDWYWWFGEPNNSGCDNVYDYMFRCHLKNVYTSLNLTPPDFLDIPIV